MKTFEEALNKAIDNAPYTPGLDDGSYNGGFIDGLEYAQELLDIHMGAALRIHDVVGRSEQCNGCEDSTGETKLWCCNHCGKRIEDF